MSAVLRVEQQHYDCPMSGVYPPSPLSVKPFTFPTITSHRDVSASAMLFAILPLTMILSTIRPPKCPNAILLIELVLTHVRAAIKPLERALAMHAVLLPVTFVLPFILPHVCAETMDAILNEVTLVVGSIQPFKAALAALAAILVLPFVSRPVWPFFLTAAVLPVVQPLSIILGSVSMDVNSMSIGLVQFPLAFVDITIVVLEATKTLGFVSVPLPFIASTIRPHLHAVAVSQVALPFTRVNRSIDHLLIFCYSIVNGKLTNAALGLDQKCLPRSCRVTVCPLWRIDATTEQHGVLQHVCTAGPLS
mmetsp:Transcript_31584/g.69725  ORF Transcript_31584/g.69725 Transcript_31584/m.69725 type:complete len:306 (-) Transcript_31584:37-954(-)